MFANLFKYTFTMQQHMLHIVRKKGSKCAYKNNSNDKKRVFTFFVGQLCTFEILFFLQAKTSCNSNLTCKYSDFV